MKILDFFLKSSNMLLVRMRSPCCIPTWGSIKKGSPQLHTKRMQDTVHGPHNRIDVSLLSRQVSSTVISSWRHDSRENWRKRKLEEEETGGRKKWRKRKLVKELVKEDIDYDNKVKIIGVTHPLGSSQWLVHRNSTWPCWQLPLNTIMRHSLYPCVIEQSDSFDLVVVGRGQPRGPWA